MFGAAREWNRVSASLEKRVVSSTVDDGRDPMAYGDRGILSLCSISRCSMSAVRGVSHPCGEGVFQRGAREQGDRPIRLQRWSWSTCSKEGGSKISSDSGSIRP